MEALSALGVAAAVVQFVDFGSRLLHGMVEIHRSGSDQLTEHAQLAQLSSDLLRLTSDVEVKVKVLGRPARNDSEQIFFRLCEECSAIGRDLGASLSQAQKKSKRGKSSMGKNFMIVLRALWDKDDVKQMTRRLSDIRQEIMTAVLLLLWSQDRQREEQHEQTVELLGHLVKSTQTFRTDQRLVVDTQPALIPNGVAVSPRKGAEGAAVSVEQTTEIEADTVTEVRKLMEAKIKTTWRYSSISDTIDLGLSGYPISSADRHGAEMSIIRSLCYESMGLRAEAIPGAHAKTFHWIFEEPRLGDDDESLWSSFSGWLGRKDHQEVYWVTGKPGAGKSTLMRFILENCRSKLVACLNGWSDNVPVLLAGFYAWNTGKELQKSLEGLLRTVLYQFLLESPTLVDKLLPRRYMLCHDFLVLGVDVPFPDWEISELLQCFEALVSQSGPSFKLALFIDGLDEFDGDHTHHALVRLIKKISTHPGIKICVSSRPWNVFSDAFKKEPSLRLENLTRDDIQAFMKHQFAVNPGYQELKEAFPDAMRQLMLDIVEKGKGVFLWISIVVQNLLAEFTDGSLLSELQAIVDNLPEDLSRLYGSIWQRIQPKFRKEASKYIQLLEKARNYKDYPHLSLDLLWLSHEDVPVSLDLEGMSNESREACRRPIERRLNSRTKNLLEVSRKSGYVDYLHRTAQEWVLLQWEQIVQDGPAQFDPALWLLKGFYISLSLWTRGLTPLQNKNDLSPFWECCRDISDAQNPQFRQLMSALERNTACGKDACWVCDYWASPHEASFLYFCTTMRLDNYVSDRIKSAPKSMLEVSKNSFPFLILQVAIFGCICSYEIPQRIASIPPGPIQKVSGGLAGLRTLSKALPQYRLERLELVKFLLSTCTYSEDIIASIWKGVNCLLSQSQDLKDLQSMRHQLSEAEKNRLEVFWGINITEIICYLEALEPILSVGSKKKRQFEIIKDFFRKLKAKLRARF
ncbi:hypothetical protein QBC44DRAFT_388299 [Cladorrhinum sp. PSN332]|nr:hypothetical protein QBC44DRAFT_388299 [Cladorrhinum sp. PSN332]